MFTDLLQPAEPEANVGANVYAPGVRAKVHRKLQDESCEADRFAYDRDLA